MEESQSDIVPVLLTNENIMPKRLLDGRNRYLAAIKAIGEDADKDAEVKPDFEVDNEH
jgi:hypothetical protein